MMKLYVFMEGVGGARDGKEHKEEKNQPAISQLRDNIAYTSECRFSVTFYTLRCFFSKYAIVEVPFFIYEEYFVCPCHHFSLS